MKPRDEGTVGRVVEEITDERIRQITIERFSREHDDLNNCNSELALAAASYCLSAAEEAEPNQHWPWNSEWWKPTTARRDLIKAAALIVAEIQRLDRVTKGET